MEQNLQNVIDFLDKNIHISEEEKAFLISSLKETDKNITITEFKLDRTEKVKRTTAILLEETIEELEKKRIAVEAQNRELEIEASLERVRARTMAMQHSDELQDTALLLFQQVRALGLPSFAAGFNIWDDDMKAATAWMATENSLQPPFKTSSSEDVFLHIYQAAQRGESLFVREQGGDELEIHYRYMASIPIFKSIMENWEQRGVSVPTFQILHCAFFSQGYLLFISHQPVPEAYDIFKRFAKVFEQTYTRFLDLQKAEAQARESQIETALERVRSRTMGMHKSDELQEVSKIIIQQIVFLNFPLFGFGIHICHENEPVSEAWIGDPTKGQVPTVRYEHTHDSLSKLMYKGWKEGASLLVKKVEGKELKEHFDYMVTITPIKSIFEPATAPEFIIYHFAYFSHGFFVIAMLSPYEEAQTILKRFAKVFEQTYTRFLDLQKAEAQSREAQIELALERVRARTMAMQKSEELHETSQILFQQMKELGEPVEQLTIGIIKEPENVVEIFATVEGSQLQQAFRHSIDEPIVMNKIYRGWKAQQKSLLVEMNSEEIQAYNRYRNELVKSEMFSTTLSKDDRRIIYAAYFSKGMLALGSNTPLAEESHRLLERFAGVFDGTYTRFLDLQKAEAQAREAQIELALERVRARTMAMQKSEELADAAQLLYQEFGTLGINTFTCGYMFIDEEKNTQTGWVVLPDGTLLPNYIVFPLKGDQVLDSRYQDWKVKKPLHVYEIQGEVNKEHHLFLSKHVPAFVAEEIFSHMPERIVFHCPNFSYGYLLILAEEFLTPEEQQTIIRFANVFEMTYTRFLDLQKAEAQVREAQIELALERVRARTMAMQKSDELPEISSLLFQQVKELGVTAIQNSISIVNEKAGFVELSTTIHGSHLLHTINVPINDPYVMAKAVSAWKAKHKSLTLEFEGQELKNYNELRNSFLETKVSFPEDRWIVNISFFSKGWLSFSTDKNVSDEINVVLKRFAAVFEQTYTRFLDLQKAEAQAREATIEAALERVRSRTLAMQKSDELAETAAVLFKQLINLGIEPNRLYINIVKDETGEAEFWITDEDGNKVSMAYADNMNNNPSFKKMFNGWRQQKKSLVIDMKGKELQQYFNYLNSIHVPFKGGHSQKRRIQYISYFSKGFIGIASPDEQPAETLQLLERFAYVFNLTFTRFNDLQIAEAHAVQADHDLIAIKAAKRKAEDALNELQLTQKQLVQSEKMASLGELTAGIAHEIQNPLNFVNNFSEVNKELLLEMKEEIDKGNINEVKIIADDLINNQEKINQHGKRADAIVKGMLQHSRSSSGLKEPTDINALADEYLRLAYHGLRAKDKSFNAKFETDFDDNVGKINIIPQDIGRVILNLLTNAFYAVNEKKKQQTDVYEPKVSVSTKKINDNVEISISDNGNGIPKKVLDKIYQPFFTTKPSGQGTGLGLSLSYDIVKAHGGELKVETKEGEGAEFILSLPERKI